MSEDAPVEAQYDASRVMFNGAAIALVTNLTNGIQQSLTAEIRAAEQRQNERLDSAVRALTGDVDELEEWRRSEMDARLVRDGQWSVFRNTAHLADRYGKVILGIGLPLAAALFLLLGVNIRVGS